MSPLHEYEAYLDSLDERFRRHGSEVAVSFSRPFAIDLRRCSSLEGILAETRELTIRLADEPGRVDIQYLVERLVRFSKEFEQEAGAVPAAPRLRRTGDGRSRRKTQQELLRESKELASSIGLVGIDDVVRTGSAAGGNPSLRFENRTGPYAGRHFVELERTGPAGVRVTRSMSGHRGHHTAHVAGLDAVETDTSLLLFLPEPLSWTDDPPVADVHWYWMRGTRVRLRHSFEEHELQTIRTELRSLMEGLPFTYSCRKTSKKNPGPEQAPSEQAASTTVGGRQLPLL